MTGKTVVATVMALFACLLVASYAGGEKEKSSSENVPETHTLGDLAKIYQPVTFSHESHTLFAEDCATCHHHSQAGETPACKTCHDDGLKDAYHGLCMGCHKKMEMGPTGCTQCHAIKSTKMASAKKKAKEGSETYLLNRLEKIYEPVIFSHEMHTMMAEDCATCHHHSPAEQTLACNECHGDPFDPDNLNMPGLKGAYHLQCMGCHQEMGSGPTGCTECHDKKIVQATESEDK